MGALAQAFITLAWHIVSSALNTDWRYCNRTNDTSSGVVLEQKKTSHYNILLFKNKMFSYHDFEYIFVKVL